MIESVNNIYKRMNEIVKGGKNISDSLKPEMIKDFENMYKEAISNSNTKKEIITDEIHPYLKANKVQKLDIEDPVIISDKKTLIDNAIENASKKYNISPDLIRAVIKTESGFDPLSVSKTGAMGLMQLMPKTALEMGVEKPFDISENIDGGTKYLKLMLEKYQGNLDKTLSAYNAGPNRVDEANGIPNIPETQNYVKQIKKILFKDEE
ncbi:MAG: hypothetical protein A2086_03565 [Spirochaetes bacterium GWD1_27_9]|nr:MAG: hypothetical protein A2Z98_09465 [Spirochaetes bacterium GWB1_27_13]OHD31133.1 MAG: hypothetical protein A2086_03565 [Spirochaetes bacterium GWD1_27_9]